MVAARKVSTPRPTKWNPFSLSGPLSAMSTVCSLHERERDRELHPLAYDPTAWGWPETIKWRRIPQRVVSLVDHIQRIVDDVDEEWQTSSQFKRIERSLEEDANLLVVRPRKENFFWKAITNDVIAHGLRYIKDLGGQTEIYKRTKPG